MRHTGQQQKMNSTMKAKRIHKAFHYIPREAVIWITALVWLAMITPGASHFSICPIHLLGLSYCPGCGLGLSVSYLLHGQLAQSFEAHPLGTIALAVLVYRIITLIRFSYLQFTQQNNTNNE